jgi:hypothetical protein
LEDWQPIDGKGSYGNYVRDTLLIERQWDRILSLSSDNLLEYTTRNKLKCALLGQLYFVKNRFESRKYKEILAALDTIMRGSKDSPQEEIQKCFELMGIIRMMLQKSAMNEPKSLTWDDNGK